MQSGYDEDSVPQDEESTETAPDDEAAEGEGGKISQEQAHYRRGSPVQHCGVCMHFVKPADDGNAGACTKVAGVISPYGLSDVYAESRNPFGPTLGPQERGMIDEMSQSGPDQSRFAQPPDARAPQMQGMPMGGMRIGRQSY